MVISIEKLLLLELELEMFEMEQTITELQNDNNV
jgi:hypothetical protein